MTLFAWQRLGRLLSHGTVQRVQRLGRLNTLNRSLARCGVSEHVHANGYAQGVHCPPFLFGLQDVQCVYESMDLQMA